ncbi:RDD domain-containing protein [Haloferula helveola]|uniref:RDD domain-containing protein n=1 Tax=Haloferula helveola TaxID=490095 RepID=A0ABN6H9I4_9BACT|nr:RDD domain-containing protein [Haloferula helveola]
MQDPTENPYAAPTTVEASPVVIESSAAAIPETASLGLRFANLIIDRIASMVVVFVISFAYGFALVASGSEIEEDFGTGMELVLALGSTFLYYAACESIFGRTLGKLITGTKVIDENGAKPSFLRALARTVCRFIPFEPFSFFGSEQRGWHDSITRTWVVKCR